MCYLGPRRFGGVIWYPVFGETLIEDFEPVFEFRTLSTPAGVVTVVAVDAEFHFVSVAV